MHLKNYYPKKSYRPFSKISFFRDFWRDYDNLNVAVDPNVSEKMSELIKHKLQLMSETRTETRGFLFA